MLVVVAAVMVVDEVLVAVEVVVGSSTNGSNAHGA